MRKKKSVGVKEATMEGKSKNVSYCTASIHYMFSCYSPVELVMTLLTTSTSPLHIKPAQSLYTVMDCNLLQHTHTLFYDH